MQRGPPGSSRRHTILPLPAVEITEGIAHSGGALFVALSFEEAERGFQSPRAWSALPRFEQNLSPSAKSNELRLLVAKPRLDWQTNCRPVQR
ncbi:MAG: hypothetical protein WKF84_08015 [Pyrinomonadaceae bacterium]